MDITEISNALGLSSGKVALALVIFRFIGEAIGSLRNGGGLVGLFRSIVYGQGVPKPIATDYKVELAKPEDKGGAGPAVMLLLAGVLALASLGMTGCKSKLEEGGAYNGNRLLYSADQTIVSSYSVFDAFVKFEYANRDALDDKPEVKRAADYIRANSKNWVTSAIALRDAYALQPDASHASALKSALAVLETELGEASRYLISQTKNETLKN